MRMWKNWHSPPVPRRPAIPAVLPPLRSRRRIAVPPSQLHIGANAPWPPVEGCHLVSIGLPSLNRTRTLMASLPTFISSLYHSLAPSCHAAKQQNILGRQFGGGGCGMRIGPIISTFEITGGLLVRDGCAVKPAAMPCCRRANVTKRIARALRIDFVSKSMPCASSNSTAEVFETSTLSCGLSLVTSSVKMVASWLARETAT